LLQSLLVRYPKCFEEGAQFRRGVLFGFRWILVIDGAAHEFRSRHMARRGISLDDFLVVAEMGTIKRSVA
jgi:uncharacterized metal-binding protein